MHDLLKISQNMEDDKLTAVAEGGDFYQAIKEISKRDDSKSILEKILENKPHKEEIMNFLNPHFGTHGLYSVLTQVGLVIGEDNFYQGKDFLEIMKSYSKQIDITSISETVREISDKFDDLRILKKLMGKYEFLEGKESILNSLVKLQEDSLNKGIFYEVTNSWRDKNVVELISYLQGRKGLRSSIFALTETVNSIKEPKAIIEVAKFSRGLTIEDRFDKMNFIGEIIKWKGDKNNFYDILETGKNNSKENLSNIKNISLWIENKKTFNELLKISSKQNLGDSLKYLEKTSYDCNQNISKMNFEVLKYYCKREGREKTMKEMSTISRFSQDEELVSIAKDIALTYGHEKRDRYLMEIRRYSVKGDFEKAKQIGNKYLNLVKKEREVDEEFSLFDFLKGLNPFSFSYTPKPL